MEYELICSSTPAGLSEKVTQALVNGDSLYGSPVISGNGNLYCQAVLKAHREIPMQEWTKVHTIESAFGWNR